MQYVKELQVKYVKRRVSDKVPLGNVVTEPETAGQLLIHLLGKEPVEKAVVLLLNAHHNLLCFRQVSQGGVSHAPLPVGEIVKVALLANATGVVLGHNHPSGNLASSPEDRAVAPRLKEALDLVGVILYDSLVVSHDSYVSLMHGVSGKKED